MQLGHTNMPHGCHTLASGLKFMVGVANASVNVAAQIKSVLGLKSDFVFKIAHLLGFPWGHHGLFATLSSRLVKKFRDISTICANRDTTGTEA